MSDVDYICGLFEETIVLAEEEKVANNLDSFVSFIHEMLPSDIIFKLQEIAGGSDYLEEVWMERFESKITLEEDDDEVSLHMTPSECNICERDVRLTRHHLYPREIHAKLIKNGYSKSELNSTIAICRLCHSTIHKFFTNDELANEFYTVDRLLANESFYRYANWASKLSNSRSTTSVR